MIARLLDNLEKVKKCNKDSICEGTCKLKELVQLDAKSLIQKNKQLHLGYVRELETEGYYIDEHRSSKHGLSISCHYFTIPF